MPTAGLGLIIGLALVWWVRPDTSSGTTFLLVATMLAAFAVRGMVLGLRAVLGKARSTHRPRRSK